MAVGSMLGSGVGALTGLGLTPASRGDDPLEVDDDYGQRARRNAIRGGATGAVLGGLVGRHYGRMSQGVKNLVMAGGTGAAVAGGTYAFNKAFDAVDEAHVRSNRHANASAMLAEHPRLAELSREQFSKAYNSVEAYAPEFLDDPYIGGELVYNIATRPNRLAALRDARTLAQQIGGSHERDLVSNVGHELTRAAVMQAMKKEGSVYKYLTEEQRVAVAGRTIDTLEKSASATTPAAPSILPSLLAPTLGALTAAGVAYAVPAAVEAVQGMKIRANRDKYLAEMKKVHPDMRSISDSDLHIAYNSIAQHTPDVLKDPLLGGQTLKQMAQFRMANVQSLNEISRLRGQRPLDVALQTSTQFLAQGAADVAKTYTQYRVEDARNRIQQARLDQTAAQIAADRAYRTSRDAVTDRQFEQNIGLREKDQTYREGRDKVLDKRYGEEQAYREGRDKVLDKQFGLNFGQRKDEQDYRRSRDTVLDGRYDAEQTYREGRDKVLDKQFGLNLGQRKGEQDYRRSRDTVLDKRYTREEADRNAQYKDTYALNYARMEMDRAKAESQHELAVLNMQLNAEDKYERTFGDISRNESGHVTGTREPNLGSAMYSTRQRLMNVVVGNYPSHLPFLPTKRKFP